uniref:Uncharacterized protein n=1 Tax=Oryza glumipatula TaxID=40148 RepID=A0A0D9YC04_9ORYZ
MASGGRENGLLLCYCLLRLSPIFLLLLSVLLPTPLQRGRVGVRICIRSHPDQRPRLHGRRLCCPLSPAAVFPYHCHLLAQIQHRSPLPRPQDNEARMVSLTGRPPLAHVSSSASAARRLVASGVLLVLEGARGSDRLVASFSRAPSPPPLQLPPRKLWLRYPP